MRILLAEEDRALGQALSDGLRHLGHAVDWIEDGRHAALALADTHYAAAILDWNLPRMSGVDVLKELRERGDRTPVLLLTARDAQDDRVQGLDSGADDYVVKPVHLDELAARMRALLRRAEGNPAPLQHIGALTLDPGSRTARLADTSLDLSSREYALLEALAAHPGACAVAPATGGGGLRLGRGGRQQRDRSAHPPFASQAGWRLDPHAAWHRLRAVPARSRPGHPAMSRPSLHRRLLWWAGLPMLVLWLATGAWLGERTAHETGEMFDRELQRTAASVLAVVSAAPDRRQPLRDATSHPPHEGQRPEIVVRDHGGRVLLDASTLPAEPPGTRESSFRTLRRAGESWRLFQTWDASHRYWIQVAAPLHDR